MKKEIPYFAIGNDELVEKPEAKGFVTCRMCKKKHKIKYGKQKQEDGTWKKSKMLGFYNCGKESYLATINNKLI